MAITTGQIVKNLIPAEPVTITKIQHLGPMISVSYTGVNSAKANTKVIDEQTFADLEVLTEEGTFNFKDDPQRFALYAEADRIRSAYQFDPLFAVNCSVVDPLPHQVEAVYKFLLPLPKIRFLLADDTGAGKTIMTGLLIKELMMRGMAERILIVTPGGLTKQWQEDEMSLKFNLPFKLVNRASFISEPNVFSSSNLIITSIDFLRGEDVLNVVKETSWDLIVVDEAHKLSAFDYGRKRYLSKRYVAMETLASKCEHLLLLTATPHRGRRDTFKNLLFCFDKQVFLEYQNASSIGRLNYINPGNPIFDSLVSVIRMLYKEDVLKGTVMISLDDQFDYFTFFVRSQITDNRPHTGSESIADEELCLVCRTGKINSRFMNW